MDDEEVMLGIGRWYNRMANVKAAVSLQKSLFEQADAVAREMNISRSHLFALALEEFIRSYQNQQLLEQINAAYDDTPDPADELLRQHMCRQHRQIVEGEW